MVDEAIVDLDVTTEKIGFAKILMRQIDRIGIAAITSNRGDPNVQFQSTEDFVRMSINILNCLLAPYKDKHYRAKVEELKKARESEGVEFGMWDKFEALVQLMHNRGLLLKESIEINEV